MWNPEGYHFCTGRCEVKDADSSSVRSNKLLCRICGNLKVQITRHGLKPYCRKNMLKFKERERVEWQKDKDLRRTCGRYIPFET